MRAFFTYIFATAALLAMPCLLCGQSETRFSRAAVDSLRKQKAMAAAGQVLKFDNQKVDMGILHESDTVRDVVFTFRNVSDTAVTITEVTTHCGCTAAEFAKEPIEAGASSEIMIKYNPKGRYGTVDTGAFVYTDQTGRRPVAKLTLLGNVIDDDEWSHLPYAMGELKLKRKQVVFKNGRRVSRIACANVGTKPVRLSAELLPEHIAFATEPQTIEPGEEGDIIISVDSLFLLQGAAGTARRYSIIVGGVTGTPSSRTIKAIIE